MNRCLSALLLVVLTGGAFLLTLVTVQANPRRSLPVESDADTATPIARTVGTPRNIASESDEKIFDAHTVRNLLVAALENPPNPYRFEARWLPTSQTLFCTSLDNSTAMTLRMTRAPRGAARVQHTRIPECRNTIALYTVDSHAEGPFFPESRRRVSRSALLKGKFRPRPTSTPLASDQVPFEHEVRLIANVIEELNASHLERDAESDSTMASCTRHCLGSPCCTAFQVRRNATHRWCSLFTPRQVETKEESPAPFLGEPITFLSQRREFRPSLVRDDYRLSLYGGLSRVEPLVKSCEWCLRNIAEVHLDGPFGKIRHDEVSGTLAARLTHRLTPIHAKRILLSLDRGVAIVDLSAFGPLQHLSGSDVCLDISPVPPLTSATSGALLLVDGLQWCFRIGIPTEQVGMRFVTHVADGSENRTVHGDSRAPACPTPELFLRNDECCLPGFQFFPLATRTLDSAVDSNSLLVGVPSRSSPLFIHHRLDYGLPVAPTVTVALEQNPCVSVVAGRRAVVDETGVGSFSALIVRIRCNGNNDTRWVNMTAGIPAFLRASGASEPVARTVLPTSVLMTCLRAATPIATSESAQVPLPYPDTPIAFSVRAHKDLAFLKFQIKTFAVFAPGSVVVLHLSSQWKMTTQDERDVARLNDSHPMVLANPLRVRSSPWKATHVHGANMKFILDSGVPVSHCVIWAANEVLLRSGIVPYVKRYDMSSPDRMNPFDGVSYEHVMHHVQWWSPEEHRLGTHDLWPWLPYDGVSGELIYAALLRSDGAAGYRDTRERRFPTHPLMLEGTYFNRTVMREWLRVCEAVPLSQYCTTSSQYSDNEIFPFLTMRHQCGVTPGLACGGRVSTMLWRSFLHYGSLLDVMRVRCSPFPIPFGFKRVKRGPPTTDPLLMHVLRIMDDKRRSAAPRDTAEDCTMSKEDAARIHKEFMHHVLH